MNAVFVPLTYAIRLQTNKRKCKACISTINMHVNQRKNKSKLLVHNRWPKREPRFTTFHKRKILTLRSNLINAAEVTRGKISLKS